MPHETMGSWFRSVHVKPRVVAEFEDAALSCQEIAFASAAPWAVRTMIGVGE